MNEYSLAKVQIFICRFIRKSVPLHADLKEKA